MMALRDLENGQALMLNDSILMAQSDKCFYVLGQFKDHTQGVAAFVAELEKWHPTAAEAWRIEYEKKDTAEDR